jgi:hypothetical protein
MRVILELNAEVARALQQPSAVPALPAEAVRLQQSAARLGLRLQPLHPRCTDAALARTFFVEVADAAATDATIAELRTCAAVTAAYTKPPDEAP